MSATTLAGHRPRTVLAVYEAALHRADAGAPATLTLTDHRGTEHRLDAAAWCRTHLPGDRRLLSRCSGPTLDVGCGPGRLTGALHRLGLPALGIDVSAAAVRLARRRGVAALRRDVFAPLPGHGRWRHLLLADGNIGIGGDPHALLARCRDLLAPHGAVHVEVGGPGSRSWSGDVRLHDDAGRSAPFRWAAVSADDLPVLAGTAALRHVSTWTEANRWFATLIR
jgi:SAM-dependent methyltransferase